MKILSVFKTKKFLISITIESLLFVLVGVLFSKNISNSFYVLDTWSNCESSYIAFDSRRFEENCYAFYGNTVKVNTSKGDSVRLDCDVYQFLPGVNYDNRSLLNEKNVTSGTFKILSSNEIAVPEHIHNDYKIGVGQKLVLDGKDEYIVQFIFRNFRNIKEPSIDSKDSVVFIGTSNEPIKADFNYAVFNNVTKDYNDVFLFNKTLASIRDNLMVNMIISCVLFLASIFMALVFLRKSEQKQLFKVSVSGSKKGFIETLYGFNFLLLLLPTIFCGLLIGLFGSWEVACALGIISLSVYLIKTSWLKLKFN